MKRFLFSMVTVLSLGFSANASALMIDKTNWGDCLGTSDCIIGGATLTSSTRSFEEKTVDGETGLGISGGRTGGEIDVDEWIHIAFSAAQIVNEIQILFLFNGPEFGDPQEIGLIMGTSSMGYVAPASVQASGEDTLTLSGFDAAATWASCGSTSQSGSGCFTISNPFGATGLGALSFGAFSVIPRSTNNDSDYSIGSVHTVAVPEPATLICLAIGLVGLGFGAKRRIS